MQHSSRRVSVTLPDAATYFEDLVRDHDGPLRRFVAAYAPDVESRADLLQEIWIAVWRALPTFRGECAARTFLYRIAYNRALTFRSRSRSHVPLDHVPYGEVADASPDPAAVLDAALARDALRGAVLALPDTLRGVVALYLDGSTTAEIAEVLGISENNVHVRLSRARSALRSHLTAPASTR